MKQLTIASALALCSLSSQAQSLSTVPAANPNYFEIGFTSVKYEEDTLGYSIKTTPDAIRGVLGREIHDNVALEAMFGTGLGRSSVEANGQDLSGANFKINSMYGLYVTPKTVLADNFEGFLRLGYAYARGTASYNGQSASDSDNGFSYGIGVRYHFDKTTFLNVDYMSYLNKSDYKAEGFTVGLGFRF
jgi:opacity protein-like surface antigen